MITPQVRMLMALDLNHPNKPMFIRKELHVPRCNLLAEECSQTLALVQHDIEFDLEHITFYDKCLVECQ
jgi:hypothetical protein